MIFRKTGLADFKVFTSINLAAAKIRLEIIQGISSVLTLEFLSTLVIEFAGSFSAFFASLISPTVNLF